MVLLRPRPKTCLSSSCWWPKGQLDVNVKTALGGNGAPQCASIKPIGTCSEHVNRVHAYCPAILTVGWWIQADSIGATAWNPAEQLPTFADLCDKMYLNLAQWRPSRVRDRSAALVARVRQDGCRKVVIKCESAVGPSDVVHDRVLGHHPKKTPTNVPPSLDSGSSATTPPIDSRPVPASSNVSGHTQTHPLVMSTSDGSVAHASLPAEEQHHGVQEATPIVSSLMVTIEGEISEAVFRDNSPQGTAPLQTDAREPLLSSDSGSTPDQDKNIRLTHGVPDPRRYSMEDFIVSEQASLKSRSQLSMRSGSQANSFDQGGAKASSGSSCDKARSDSNPAQGSAKASSGSNRDEQCASVSSGSPGRDSWARLRPLNPQSWQPRRAFMMPLLDVQPWAGRHSPTSYLNLVQHIEQQLWVPEGVKAAAQQPGSHSEGEGTQCQRPPQPGSSTWPAPLPFTPHPVPLWPDLVHIDDSVGAAAADDLCEQFARPAAGLGTLTHSHCSQAWIITHSTYGQQGQSGLPSAGCHIDLELSRSPITVDCDSHCCSRSRWIVTAIAPALQPAVTASRP
ncbi:hypothetical protein HaLaN_04881 [Haematococcus lacustris]|uniref:Uncharacterized protein n=1 Tax=Haematococcus lacustris TaxID=44745 RepID=A0A699Z2T8_HAELA|nr:hypothetical protein HaLaN_04881 [Haematococcus lacustris]